MSARPANHWHSASMEAPDISVIIPTFNRRDLVSRALASVLLQEDVDFEVLVIDDGSTDGTLEDLRFLGDPRVRVFRQPSNRGVSAARNRGIAEARASWVAFLDDDDFWAQDRLARHLEVAVSAAADWVYGPVLVVREDGEVVGRVPAEDDHGLTERLRGGTASVTPSTVSVRTSLALDAGGFDVKLSAYADWDLWIRLGQRGHLGHCPDALVAYADHGDKMRVREWATMPGEFAYLVSKHRWLAAESDPRWWDEDLARARRDHGRGHRLGAAWGYARAGLRYGSAADLVEGARVLLGRSAADGGPPGVSDAPPPAAPEWLQRGFRRRLADVQEKPPTA
jgi:glycosyltransferase involved in cell wall biosynthesis